MSDICCGWVAKVVDRGAPSGESYRCLQCGAGTLEPRALCGAKVRSDGSRIEARAMTSPWQPIAEAPHELPFLLVYQPGCRHCPEMVALAKWDEDERVWRDTSSDGELDPTHFLLTPPPPWGSR